LYDVRSRVRATESELAGCGAREVEEGLLRAEIARGLERERVLEAEQRAAALAHEAEAAALRGELHEARFVMTCRVRIGLLNN